MGSDRWNESPRPGFPAPERHVAETSLERCLLREREEMQEQIRHLAFESSRAREKAKHMQAIVEAARAFISDDAKWKALRDALDALDRAMGKEGDRG